MQLAGQRGKAVMDYILKSKKVERERIFMLDATIGSAKDTENVSRKRVEFILE